MDTLSSQLIQSTQVQDVSVSLNDANFKIRKARSWRGGTPLSQDFTSYFVDFEFSIELVTQEWILGPDYLLFYQERPPPNSKDFMPICHQIIKHPHPDKDTDLQDEKGIFRAIARVLTDRWTVPEPYRSKLIERAARDTMKIINSSPPRHDRFLLKADVTQIVFDFLLMPDSVQDGMVPATDESIKKLERKVISAAPDVDATGDDCTICLDEFPAGCEVVSMPCSHTFHANCILQWLKTSHYCPLCRFEMPAKEEDEEEEDT